MKYIKKILYDYFFLKIIIVIIFLILSLISTIIKFFGADILNLRFNTKNSYWENKKNSKTNMKKQF